jgi:dTDP-4-dehydrorhamnose 3,5-epimerase-like enzyme
MSRAVRRAKSSKTPANPPFSQLETLLTAIGNLAIRRLSIRDILVLVPRRHLGERGDTSETLRATDFAAFDVAVDLRRSSPTLGGQVGATLTSEGGL